MCGWWRKHQVPDENQLEETQIKWWWITVRRRRRKLAKTEKSWRREGGTSRERERGSKMANSTDKLKRSLARTQQVQYSECRCCCTWHLLIKETPGLSQGPWKGSRRHPHRSSVCSSVYLHYHAVLHVCSSATTAENFITQITIIIYFFKWRVHDFLPLQGSRVPAVLNLPRQLSCIGMIKVQLEHRWDRRMSYDRVLRTVIINHFLLPALVSSSETHLLVRRTL